MCIRIHYYLVCTNCNNQFVHPKWGGSFSSEEEAKEVALEQDWKIDVPVPNGSLWDFCPRCWARCAEEDPVI